MPRRPKPKPRRPKTYRRPSGGKPNILHRAVLAFEREARRLASGK